MTEILCPACGDIIADDGACPTCGAVVRKAAEKSSGAKPAQFEPDDDDFDPPGPYDDYTERDLEELADEAAGRYEDWLFRDRD